MYRATRRSNPTSSVHEIAWVCQQGTDGHRLYLRTDAVPLHFAEELSILPAWLHTAPSAWIWRRKVYQLTSYRKQTKNQWAGALMSEAEPFRLIDVVRRGERRSRICCGHGLMLTQLLKDVTSRHRGGVGVFLDRCGCCIWPGVPSHRRDVRHDIYRPNATSTILMEELPSCTSCCTS